ncbi:MAG: amino acid ABC transporter permease [Anaerolineales bacterium]|nr:amino acid ABC transporter permease [Anaerolineales bacterium]MDW8160583.1 amino acid ABC transporter permease [Anaerolineales bacterium]
MVIQFFTYILQGTSVTLAVTLVALPLGLILGLAFALLYNYGGLWVSRLAAVYSLAMRGVPPVALLFVLYFLLSGRLVNLSPFWAGSISLGIISSAYQMEILRGALQAVGESQMIAARAIGMSRFQAIRYIILPQAIRLAIPPWSNEASIVLKDSSLVYALGVPEILRRAQQLSATTQQPFLAFGAAALIYFILVFLANRGLDLLAEKTKLPNAAA